MQPTELKKMRRKQFIVMNVLILTFITIFFIVINLFEVTYVTFFFSLGVIALIQGLYGLLKGNSTKSFFSIFEQIATYEKQKLGKEWDKQRRMGYIWSLILSVLMFLQVYLQRNVTDHFLQFDFYLMLLIVLPILALINISLMLHIKKVDRSNSDLDLKGYTWKTNVTAIVLGISSTMILSLGIFFYILIKY